MATNNLNAPIDEGYSSMPSVKNGADPSLLAATSSDMNLEVAADSYRHESEIEFQDVNLADRIISIDELDETGTERM